MGICSAVDYTAALQALVSCPFDHRPDKGLALSTVFDTDECPRAGEVLDQVELIAVPRLRLLADCHREDEKARASRPRPASSRNMADCTSSAAVSECSSGFELEIRSSATDHDDSGGGWSLSVGAMKHESLLLSASVPGRARFRETSPASRRMASHALMIPPIAANTEAPRKLIYGIASVAWGGSTQNCPPCLGL